jgi:hypothetical protein
VPTRRLSREFGIVGRGVITGGVARRREPLFDAAAGAVAFTVELSDAAERALADQRHQVVARENDGERIAVGRRQVGEIFDVAAHLVAVVLHQQHVDLVALHGGTHRRPAPLEFGGRDRRLQAFRELFHFSKVRFICA